MQANEAIKVVAGIGKLLSGRLLVYDSLDLTVRFLNIQPQPSNPISGTNPSIKKLIDYEAFCSGAPSGNQIKEIEPKALKDLIESGAKIQVIDVREPFEFELVNLNGINIPLASVSDQIHLIQREGTVVVHCKSGGRSKTAIRLLQEKFGFNNLVNLKGGILQWIDEVNPAGQRY
jgi:adenylyltransferase/sulfurtransferase